MLDSNMIQQCEDGWLCFAEEDSEVIQIGIKDSLNIFKKYQPDLSLEPLLRAHTFFSEVVTHLCSLLGRKLFSLWLASK